ncbi:MAG: S41 family peptidase [Phycisphaerales bacterium]
MQIALGEDSERARLAALGRLYGQVRFFHPASELQDLDWGRVMVYGVQRVLAADDSESLEAALKSTFEPVAPSVLITSGNLPAQNPAVNTQHTYWEHRGVWYGPSSNMYRSQRVGIDGDAVLELSVERGEVTDIELGAGVRARIPLSLAFVESSTLPRSNVQELDRWHAMIDGLEVGDASDECVRVASTLMVWAVIEHFFPYFDVVNLDWESRLDQFLAESLKDQSSNEYYRFLCAMMAELKDGHAYVYMSAGQHWSPKAPAARFDIARDGSIVVTRSWNESLLRKGDVVVSIDGLTAAEELERWEHVTAGSDQLRRHRALNQFGTSDDGGDAAFVVRRVEGEREHEIQLLVDRSERSAMFFVQPEFEHPPISEVAEGVWLVNLLNISNAQWQEHIEEIKQAHGLIVDFRWGGSGDQDINSLTLASQFIDQPVSTVSWEVPGLVRPGFDEVLWGTDTWAIDPKEPRLKADVVFLTSPAVVSFGETVMSFWDHYGLARIVGEPTAGCNGNVNRITDLPCGMTANFTGMRVRKHDGSVLYGAGYKPDVLIERTVEQIRSGKDHALLEAINLLTDD